jgi:hypothetical protein
MKHNEDHLENLGVCGRVILKCILAGMQWEGMDLIQLASGGLLWT